MASLDQAVKEFKDILIKRNIFLIGKLTIVFGEQNECDFSYQPSLPHKPLMPNGDEQHDLSNAQICYHRNRQCSGTNFDQLNIHRNNDTDNDFTTSHLQNEETPSYVCHFVNASCKNKTTLPPFENIIRARNPNTVEASGETQMSQKIDYDKWNAQRSSTLDQFSNVLLLDDDNSPLAFQKKNEMKGQEWNNVSTDFEEANFFPVTDNEVNSLLNKRQTPLPTHPETEAWILQLLKNGHTSMISKSKELVQNYLNNLRKEELISIVFQTLENRNSVIESSSGKILKPSSCTMKAQKLRENKEQNQTETTKFELNPTVECRLETDGNDVYDLKTFSEEHPAELESVHKTIDISSTSLCVERSPRERKSSPKSQSLLKPKHLSSQQNAKPLKKRPCLRSNINDSFKNVANDDGNFSQIKEKNGNVQNTKKQNGFNCKTCHKVFPSRLIYQKHLQTHVSSYKCDICNKILKSRDSLYHHQRGLHSKEKPYHCDDCDLSFSFHHSYKLHLQKHKGERPYSCKLCPKSYLTSNHLKEHMQAVHSTNCIVCHVCGKKFSYNSTLKIHLLCHSDGKLYHCSICDKDFKSDHSLKRHSLCHKLNQRFQCDICGKHFKSAYSCNYHRKHHNKDKGKCFMCDICGKSFTYKYVLDNHIQIHNKFRTFMCNVCGKAFKSKASLYTHKYVHNEGQAFSCSVCSKSFKTKNCLLAHTKRHQSLCTHACSICGRKFPDKGGLSKHTKTVHLPQKYFSCKICGKTGTRGDNMRTHVKSHRNEVCSSDNPMDFITCMEKCDTSVSEGQSSNASVNAEKEKSQSLNKIFDADVQSSFIADKTNDSFFHVKATDSTETSLERPDQRDPHTTITVTTLDNRQCVFQTIPCGVEEKNSNSDVNTYLYPQEKDMNSMSMSVNEANLMSSFMLQSHSNTASDASTNFIPHHYDNYIHSLGNNLMSDSDRDSSVPNEDWLMPSNT